MLEWVAVVCAGALGGFAGTFLPTGTDVASPSVVRRLLAGHLWWELGYHLGRNACMGALASFVLWANYKANASFDATALVPQQIGISLVVGGGGSWIFERLVRKSQEAATNEVAATTSLEAMAELLNKLAGPAEDNADE